MGFNLNSFINTTSQSIASRALSTVTSKVDNALGGGGVASLLSGILASGASKQSIASIASIGADNIIGSLENEFFSAIGLSGANKGRLPDTLKDTDKIAVEKGSTKLQFPKDLGVYGIGFTFSRYNRPSPLVKSNDVITKAIYFPLPRELQMQHQTQYNPTSGGIVTGITDMIYQSNQDTGDDKAKAHSRQQRAAVMAGSVAVNAGTSVVDGFLGTSTGATVGQVFGAITNPNVTVEYTGPTLRTFSFSWSFSPNNKEESDELIQIFNEFNKRSLAGFTTAGSSALLSYPDSVNIQVFPKTAGSIGDLMKFKKAMVTGISIDYAPEGAAFFKGTQSPTFFDVTISFQEIEYFVSSDYGGSDNVGVSKDAKKILGAAIDQVTSKLGSNPLDQSIKTGIEQLTKGYDLGNETVPNPSERG